MVNNEMKDIYEEKKSYDKGEISNQIKKSRFKTIWLILAIMAIYCGISYISSKSYVGIKQEEDKKKINEIEGRINPNTANWASMARLPGIGEKLAQAIVDYRKIYWSENKKSQCFNRCEDLDQVRGIGPVKCEQIRSYLIFEDIKK